MKKWLAVLLVLAAIVTLCACGSKQEEAEEVIVGGWTETEEAPTDSDREVFDKAVDGTEYADYELVSTLGTQVVAGTNYKFLVKTADGAEKVMVVYCDLEQNCSVTSVEDYAG